MTNIKALLTLLLLKLNAIVETDQENGRMYLL